MYYFYILLCAWWCIYKGPYLYCKLPGLHSYLKVLQFFYFLISFFSFLNHLSWYYSSCLSTLLRVDFFFIYSVTLFQSVKCNQILTNPYSREEEIFSKWMNRDIIGFKAVPATIHEQTILLQFLRIEFLQCKRDRDFFLNT